MLKKILIGLFVLPLFYTSALAGDFTLHSNDVKNAEFMSTKHVFQGFGCTGDNQSPHLMWKNAPAETKSFALTVYDPDAPTGSGWWHWQLINIPVDTTELATNAGQKDSTSLPAGVVQITNDYGYAGFGGACPPENHGKHRYQFTLHALSVEKLDLNSDHQAALVGYMINANSIATARIETFWER